MIEAEQLATTVLEIGERLKDPELKILIAYRLAEFELEKHHFDKALEWLDQREKWCREGYYERQLAWGMYLSRSNSVSARKLRRCRTISDTQP